MRSLNGIKGAERNTIDGGLILEIADPDTGEKMFIIHIGPEIQLRVFRRGDRDRVLNLTTIENIFSIDVNGGL